MSKNVLRLVLRTASATTLLAAVITGMTGCGKATEVTVESMAEKAIEAEMGGDASVDINSEDGAFTMETKIGDETVSVQAGESISLPKNMPDDVPLPAGVTWNMVQNSTADGGGMILQGTITTPISEAAATLKAQATEQGWESVQNISSAGKMEQMIFSKGESTLSYMIGTDGKKTTVMISRN